jgi:hypothetical protein
MKSSLPRSIRPLIEFLTCPCCRANRVQIYFDIGASQPFRWAYTRWCPDCDWVSPKVEYCTAEELEVIDGVKDSLDRQLWQEIAHLENPALTLYPAALPV